MNRLIIAAPIIMHSLSAPPHPELTRTVTIEPPSAHLFSHDEEKVMWIGDGNPDPVLSRMYLYNCGPDHCSIYKPKRIKK